MIRYSTKDIIKRAEQLADLEDSGFISDFEKSALLNENWQILYQKLIDSNDKTFIKTITATNGMKLPADFYQLAEVKTENKDQINKMNSSQFYGYEIKNNTFYLSSNYNLVTIDYYPAPQTLFYSSGKKEEVDYQTNPKSIIEEDSYIDSDNLVYVNGESITQSTTKGIVLKNGVITSEGKFFDFNNNLIEERTDKPFVVKGNEVTFDDIEGENLSDFLLYITDEGERTSFFVDRNWNVYNSNRKAMSVSFSDNSLVYCREDGIYYTTYDSHIISRLSNTVENFSLNLSSFCSFVNDSECIISVNSKLYKTSYGFNSLLDYPNNLYFVVLEYMLAISFKQKQNGETDSLVARKEEAANQFYDSLNRDVNAFYQMKNYYGVNRW